MYTSAEKPSAGDYLWPQVLQRMPGIDDFCKVCVLTLQYVNYVAGSCDLYVDMNLVLTLQFIIYCTS